MASGADRDYEDARHYLETFALRDADAERDYAAQWMGTAKGFQRALDDALSLLEGARHDLEAAAAENAALLTKVRELQRVLAAKDMSFRVTTGIA